MGRGFSRIPRIYMEQPSRNQKISPQRHEATKIHTGKNVAHPCLLRVLAVKAAPKRGTAEPAAERGASMEGLHKSLNKQRFDRKVGPNVRTAGRSPISLRHW